MFQLTVRSGRNKGRSWALADRPLILGRSHECDITVVDPTVSRQQCEIFCVEGSLRLRNLSERNPTLVNGMPEEGIRLLDLGDEVALGDVLFIVSAPLEVDKEASTGRLEHTPVTLAIGDAYYLEKDLSELSQDQLPQRITDLRGLFLLGRRFNAATDMVQLNTELAAHLEQRLRPKGFWLAWLLEPGEDLVFQRDSHQEPPSPKLNEAMRRVAESGVALLLPERGKQGGRHVYRTTLVAPLVVGVESLGAIAVAGETPTGTYDEDDLEYFLGVAHALSPHLKIVAYHEQMRRDLENLRLRAGVANTLVGSSKAINTVRGLAQRAAASRLNTLILGETGTGKELVARLIHDLSPRRNMPFVALNCAAIPRNLLESELFGAERGAFTDALRSKPGRFEDAHGGTLFLDEIGDLSMENQAKILRAIENGTFYRLGAKEESKVDVRVITATHRPIDEDIKAGRFRADLYHRIAGFVVFIPPLRDRLEDVPELARHFLAEVRQCEKQGVKDYCPAALAQLSTRRWPGNVRELRSCIQRAVAMASDELIRPEDLFFGEDYTEYLEEQSRCAPLAELERRQIQLALRLHEDNVRTAAKALGISRATLYNKMKAYRIQKQGGA